MTFLLILATFLSSPATDAVWQLRSGVPSQSHQHVPGGSSYLIAILDRAASTGFPGLITALESGHTFMVVPLAAELVSRGETGAAELYWRSTEDPPATRNDLMSALAWYGRFDLYAVMASGPPVPEDMEGRLHSDHCAAICAIGWMSTRENGLFQGEDLVSPGDLLRLSEFFPGVNPEGEPVTLSDLNRLFRNPGGAE